MSEAAVIPVCLDRCSVYERSILRPLLHDFMDILGVPSDFSGKKVILKPNLISASAPFLACTNPEFAAAAALCFLERGAMVVIGDSPAFGSGRQVCEKMGFITAFKGLEVSFADFKYGVRRKLDCGLNVTVASEVLDCDCFVNLPKIKAHGQMGVTMALKNVFGIIPGARKALIHMKPGITHEIFAEIILNLHKLLPPAIGFADGIDVMHKSGPVNGERLFLGCVAAAENMVALDRALLELLDLDIKTIPMAIAALNLQLPGASFEEISFPVLRPDAFAGAGFVTVSDLSPVRFQVSQFIRGSIKRVLQWL